jgi:hypothetical protein
VNKTRNNHYVPQWYQDGFFEPGRNTYSYLDLNPPQHVLSEGRVVTERSKFTSPTSRAFCQRDLYSTFFGTSVNDEIERKLFGDIDARGPTPFAHLRARMPGNGIVTSRRSSSISACRKSARRRASTGCVRNTRA